METAAVCEELLSIADEHLKEVEQIIPDDPIQCFLLFAETVRVSDSWAVSSNYRSMDERTATQYFDIMRMGWNLAAFYLLKPIAVQGFPIRESTADTRSFIAALLHKLGCVTMIRRAVDMIRSGLLVVEKSANEYTFKKTSIADAQFIDELEFSYLNDLEQKINANSGQFISGWNIVEFQNFEDVFFKPGNFFAQRKKEPSKFLVSDIDSLLAPHIKPWHSGHGIMMGYGGTEEIDYHYLALATELVSEWRDEAGLHPQTKIGSINGGELSVVILALVSFYLKHIGFIRVAAKNHPEISIPQSLTIWTPKQEMIQDISSFTGMKKSAVAEAFEAIILNADDAGLLRSHTSKFMPVLIGLGNDYVLRPLSSIAQNPFFSIIALLEYRNPNLRHHISLPREEWIRGELYAMFAGIRYQRTESNVKLRNGNNVVTDIDAAVYDNLTGEVALFQIKWQDFFFNDVKKLRNRASNLTRDLDEWAEKTTAWIALHGKNELANKLGLKPLTAKSISAVYLFAISRNMARMRGYGFNIRSENLAIANWPQFARIRFEAGPAEKVLHTLYETLKNQQNKTIKPHPLPVKFQTGIVTLNFEDLWSTMDNADSQDS